MKHYARIIGTGSYVPEKVVTNDEISRRLGEDINDFVSQVLGIHERHICAENESTADVAEAAAREALESSGLQPEELDLIIVATDTPEYISPATSVVVQHRLGAKNAGTFDVNCACAGFVTAFDVGAKYIMADEQYRHVLVIGAYAMSKYVDWMDKKTCTIFADGAGAVVLQASAEPGLLASKLIADGQYHDYLGVYAGGTKMPMTEAVLRQGFYNKVRIVQKYPPEINTEGWTAIIGDLLPRCGLTLKDIDLYLFTQVNLSTIKEVMQRFELPISRTHTIMHKWGYTGSGCIPMALDDAVRAGKLQRGNLVVMCASGGGMNMAAVVLRW